MRSQCDRSAVAVRFAVAVAVRFAVAVAVRFAVAVAVRSQCGSQYSHSVERQIEEGSDSSSLFNMYNFRFIIT